VVFFAITFAQCQQRQSRNENGSLTTVASENGAAEHNARHQMASTSRANSSKELSGHRASSKKQFHAGGATPGAVTGHRDITGRGHAIHFALLPWLCREGGREEEEEAQQTGRKKALYPQIVYLLIRENNWVEFIISRVPARARARESIAA